MMQISDTVYPMYKAFIEPDLKTAHLKIYNTFNPFSGGSIGLSSLYILSVFDNQGYFVLRSLVSQTQIQSETVRLPSSPFALVHAAEYTTLWSFPSWCRTLEHKLS